MTENVFPNVTSILKYTVRVKNVWQGSATFFTIYLYQSLYVEGFLCYSLNDILMKMRFKKIDQDKNFGSVHSFSLLSIYVPSVKGYLSYGLSNRLKFDLQTVNLGQNFFLQ